MSAGDRLVSGCIEGRPHCPHLTGTGSSYGTGGADQVLCCWCGIVWSRPWHIKGEPIPEHGPHAHRNVKVYNDSER